MIEPSYLIREGLKMVVSQIHQSVHFEEIEQRPNNFQQLIRRFQPQLVFVQISLLSKEDIFYRPPHTTICYIAIYESLIEPKTKAKFDEFLSLKSPKSKLLSMLKNVLTNTLGRNEETTDYQLTKRETEILKLLAKGHTNNDIAGKLFISSHTVMTHRKNIIRKLEIKTVSGLTVYAILNKLILAEEL